ncbi:MAG: hypothetical protein JWP17_358 [Solirubrobacterales bacterium]|nr:hypothetical protein [Solirubrobacterales bacterium]
MDAGFVLTTDALATQLCASHGWGPQETGVLATMLLGQLDIATDDCVRTDWTTRRAAVQQALTTTWVALLRRPQRVTPSSGRFASPDPGNQPRAPLRASTIAICT